MLVLIALFVRTNFEKVKAKTADYKILFFRRWYIVL